MDDTVSLEVERTSPFGFMSSGKWYNPDKFKKPNFGSINVGDTLSVTLNKAGFVTAVSGGTREGGAVATATPGKTVARTYGKSKEEQGAIARATAVKAVFGSPILYDIYKGESDKGEVAKELMSLTKQIASYIVDGEFDGLPKEDA